MNIPTTFDKRPTIELVRAFGERNAVETEALNQAPASDHELLDSYSETVSGVVEKVAPTVVNIRTHHIDRASRNGSESGGAGWHMSVDDLLEIMGTFRRKGTIMSKTQAQTMLDDGFGIDVRMPTPLGTLYNKNGAWGDAAGHVALDLELGVLRDGDDIRRAGEDAVREAMPVLGMQRVP